MRLMPSSVHGLQFALSAGWPSHLVTRIYGSHWDFNFARIAVLS